MMEQENSIKVIQLKTFVHQSLKYCQQWWGMVAIVAPAVELEKRNLLSRRHEGMCNHHTQEVEIGQS